MRFGLPSDQVITNLSGLSFSFQGYTTRRTNSTDTIRFYLRNSSIGGSSVIYEQSNFPVAHSWRTYTFDFSSQIIPAEVVAAGGYDEIMIAVGLGDTTGTTYYLDRIKHISSFIDPNAPNKADWMSGSWGTRLIVPGGVRLDNVAATSNFVAGAQEIVDELPTSDHVITSFTHPAHGYYFCLRQNAYVDIANEIHPDFVPSLANEQVILNVIQVLRAAGKKVILYVATDGPSATGGTPDNATLSNAWKAYYNSTWGGDEYAAYKNLCKGFFERFAGLVDGYWLDHMSFFPGTNAERNDFVQMIRTIDPNVAIATNINKSYFASTGGEIEVDTDNAQERIGLDNYQGAIDSRDYQVIKLEANDNLMDFTPGHPTPLGYGAPPNSWAYEEYTIPDIIQNPIDSFNGSRQVVKHFWVPMRATWTGATQPLWFDDVTAHRFVDSIVGGNGGITWANTMTGGSITPADLAILKYVDQKLQAGEAPLEAYVRPEGAYLVGEQLSPFDAWVRSVAGNTDNTRAGDSDGDGVSNFFEFAYGGDPTVVDVNEAMIGLEISINGAGDAEVGYNRRKNTGLTYTLETSETINPGNWRPSSNSEAAASVSTDIERISAAPFPTASTPKLFMRVTVSE